MKNIFTLITIFLLSINFSFSQKLKHELTSPWFIGLNAGGTWHHTDVRTKINVGAGFTFGRTFNRDYGNIFSYDLKFRFLGGSWIGQNTSKTDFSDYDNTTLSEDPYDYKKSLGYSINNFKTKSYEFNLELSIHLNRLTERTGIDPYIFGGIGVTAFSTKGNLTDGNDLIYDYNLIDNYSKSSLSSFMDKSYETRLDGTSIFGNAEMMGHVGFGLGYYLSRNVAIGFEHKTTFTGGDRFDGVFANQGKLKKDIYHYTSLYLKIYFNRGGREHDETVKPTKPVGPVDPMPSNPPTNPPTNPTPSNDCPVPVLTLQTAGNTTVNQPVFQVNGSVLNSTNREIYGTLNNVNSGVFTQNGNQNFTGTFQLTPGLNTIVVTSTNNCGTDSKTIQVNYVVECKTPLVSFTSPTSSNSTTTLASLPVQATISDLGSGTIQFYVNNQQSTNYNYNNSTGQFTANVSLQNGNNTIQINVSNNCGSNSQTVSVQYSTTTNCPAPTIDLKSPTTNKGESNSVELSAIIKNVTTANQVEVFINGTKQPVGVLFPRNYLFSQSLNLANGRNTIIVRATNNCGTDEETIIYDCNQPCIEPSILITDPAGTRIVSTTENYTVRATIKNITTPQNIEFRVNGSISTNFNYNVQSGLFTATIKLKNNDNRIDISAVNECGKVSASTTISYNTPCDKPVITLVKPTSNTSTTAKDFTLEATITGISFASDVTVLVNGVNQSVGSYNSNSLSYSKVIQLQEGNNLIQLTAKNNCGEFTTSVTITYKRGVVTGNKPTVDFTNNCGVTVAAGKYKFTGVVLGVTETPQIQVKFQNQIYNSVVYKRITNGFSFELEINADYSQSYTIEITATNTFGSITKNCQISTENKPIVDKDITICVPRGRTNVTMVIKESQWAEYQKIGATLGACPVVDNDITICVPQGTKNVTMVIKQSQWAEYQAKGATLGACVIPVDNDITICVPRGRTNVTMVIKESQWAEYQKIGATLGACPVVDNDITICVPQGTNNVTMVIKQSQWAEYQAKGATLGACVIPVDNDITICVPRGRTNVTMVIKESQWAEYQKIGAKLGACQVVDNDITICLPQGTKNVTMVIKQSQWAEYQAKGATLGACVIPVDNDITICLPQGTKNVTMVIKQSQWAEYQAKGATLGACVIPVDNDITICLPQGTTNVTMVIKQSQWAEYQAKGATLGACTQGTVNPQTDSTGNKIPSDKMQICIKENDTLVTKLINKLEWPLYRRKGATEGPCATEGPLNINTGVKNDQPRKPGIEQKEVTPIVSPRKGN